MVLDPAHAEADLAAGGLPCGGCGRSLAPRGGGHERAAADGRIIDELAEAGISHDEVCVDDQGPAVQCPRDGLQLLGDRCRVQDDHGIEAEPSEPLGDGGQGIGPGGSGADERPHASGSRSPGGEVRKPIPQARCMLA